MHSIGRIVNGMDGLDVWCKLYAVLILVSSLRFGGEADQKAQKETKIVCSNSAKYIFALFLCIFVFHSLSLVDTFVGLHRSVRTHIHLYGQASILHGKVDALWENDENGFVADHIDILFIYNLTRINIKIIIAHRQRCSVLVWKWMIYAPILNVWYFFVVIIIVSPSLHL